MTDDYRQANWSTVNSFSDVKEGDWYNNAISTCARAGALKGRGDGSVFDPNANITRAEFAVIAARFLDSSYVDDGKGDFADTADHWAAKEIRLAAKAGWVNGNGNTFNPDAYITRAEVMAIVNRMLDRTPDKDHMLPDMKSWRPSPAPGRPSPGVPSPESRTPQPSRRGCSHARWWLPVPPRSTRRPPGGG